jgi:hypothetical protein
MFWAALPATIYLPVLFLLITIAFKIDLSGPGMQVYYMYCSIPMYVPSAINSLVTILAIRDYRVVAGRLFRRLFAVRIRCSMSVVSVRPICICLLMRCFYIFEFL